MTEPSSASQAHLQGSGLEVEELGLELVPLRGAGVPSGGLTCCVKKHIVFTNILKCVNKVCFSEFEKTYRLFQRLKTEKGPLFHLINPVMNGAVCFPLNQHSLL